MFRSLYSRLALSLLILVTVLGVVLLWVAQHTSDLYSQEITQRLNHSIAMYVTEQDQLIRDGVVNSAAMDRLSNRVMTINPTVEVYLLDADGKVIADLLPEGEDTRTHVSLAPISAFLSGQAEFPLHGDDPRNGDPRVFSASPILEDGEVTGYLYAVLGGRKYQSLKDAVAASYILQVGSVAMIGSLTLALLAALVIFFFLTRRLSALQQEVESFRAVSPQNADLITPPEGELDEIDALRAAFADMSRDIRDQFQALQSLDATRRELVANVSHDLRTPLASMQGYIETLLIKGEQLDRDEQKQYLEIAHKHSRRLNTLIAELFELAKLDSGAVSPAIEEFSLLELVHDCVQDFSLAAEQRNLSLNVDAGVANCFVRADISLIQRVLQNLVDNALRHTPAGQSVTVGLHDEEGRAVVTVTDTGNGIDRHELPYIFERFYQSQQSAPTQQLGAGLGLAIVKKILDLHQSTIRVASQQGEGTRFTFDLPLQVA